MKDITLDQLEARFGASFVRALGRTMRLDTGQAEALDAWAVGQAKDHFSEMLDRVRDGECQLVRRRSEDPALMISVAQFAAFVELAAPKRRFADAITHDPDLPVGRPITVSDAAKSGEAAELRALSI